MIYSIQPNMIPMRDIKQISDGDKLFYELGRKLDSEGGYGDNWIKTGKFQEIEDVKNFLLNDRSLSQLDYLEHHNFMLIKKNTDMEKEFVPYELSLRIKQLGFKEPCFGEYNTHQGSEWILSINPSHIQYSKSAGACLAPTYSQAFKFLIPLQDEFKVCLGENGWYIYNLENDMFDYNALEKMIEILETKKDK